MRTAVCRLCDKFGLERKCRGCEKVSYCTEVCQGADWRRHRRECNVARERREERRRLRRLRMEVD